MRWKVFLVALALLAPLSAAADTHIKIERHTDGYYRGGRMNPEVDETRELWVGENKMAYETDTQKFVLDAEAGKLWFINLRDNSYAETPLPLDMSKLFAEEDFARLQMFKRTGEVKKTDESKKIGEWQCSAYDLHDWYPYQGGRVSEREVRMWVAAEVPFDLEKFDAMFSNLITLENFEEDYGEQVLAIGGFRIATEETTYAEGIAIKTTTKVVDMTEAEPPTDAYALPEGCTRKETLSLQDM
jgi:hypothetical protein